MMAVNFLLFVYIFSFVGCMFAWVRNGGDSWKWGFLIAWVPLVNTGCLIVAWLSGEFD